jgi:uncharacterized protein YukE
MTMSMDEQYAQMRRFNDALLAFDTQLRASMQDLDARHDEVTPYWQDEMRRQYDDQWGPLHATMTGYIEREGPQYEQFLQDKIQALTKYLNGQR